MYLPRLVFVKRSFTCFEENIVIDTHSPSYIFCFQVKGLPSHEGPKVRHNKKDTKISRKDMRKQEQERKDPKLRRKRQKRRAEENEANSRSGHYLNFLIPH